MAAARIETDSLMISTRTRCANWTRSVEGARLAAPEPAVFEEPELSFKASRPLPSLRMSVSRRPTSSQPTSTTSLSLFGDGSAWPGKRS